MIKRCKYNAKVVKIFVAALDATYEIVTEKVFLYLIIIEEFA
jgi:hypothetical protein